MSKSEEFRALDAMGVDTRGAEMPLDPALRRAIAEIILDTTSEGIWLINASACTTFVNRHTAIMLGYAPEEMIGRSVFSFMDDEWRAICERDLAQRRDGVGGQVEFKLQRKDGGEVWVLLTSNGIRDRQGNYAGALALLNDITERKHHEFAMQQLLSELDQRVAERTRDLAEANRRLLELTNRDEATGLYNRGYLLERLVQETARALRKPLKFCLLFVLVDRTNENDAVDLRRCEQILRRLGHTAPRLYPADVTGTRSLRISDVAARWGSAELAVLAPDTFLSGASMLAERLREQAQRWAQTEHEPALRGATLSIGIASWGYHAGGIEELIAKASAAAKAARAAGGNRVGLADPMLPPPRPQT